MNPATVYISRHAWLRFITRHGDPLPTCPMCAIRRMLAMANPEDLGSGATIRLMNNGLTPAVYYATDNWRLVLNESETTLMTVERIVFKKRTKNKPHRRRRD